MGGQSIRSKLKYNPLEIGDFFLYYLKMKKILLALFFVLVACSFVTTKPNKPTQIANGDTLTVENLTLTVWSLPFKHKDIIIAQAILETGWFKSTNCLNNNNLFGMKRSYSRASTYDTTINGYAHYSNWKMSVIDYYLLQSVRESIIRTSRDQYFRYLDKTYSEVGSNYSSQLKDIIARLNLPKDWENDQTTRKKTKKVIHKKPVQKKKLAVKK
jgi:hypothetical protein